MRDVPVEILAQIAARQGLVIRNFLWIKARNRTTRLIETIGIWSGEDHQDFIVAGENRTYYGAGAFISLGELQQESGLYIKKLTANAAPISVELITALRQYDPKFAPVEVHLGFFSPETNNLIAPLYRVFKGWIDKMPIKTPPIGGEGSATINMVGHSRLLTKALASKRSNETQRQRDPNDNFFADVAITGTVQTPWGSK